MRRRSAQGIAIVSVLMITTTILILVIVFSSAALSEKRTATTNTVVNETLLAADSLSERGRIKLVEVYNSGNYSIGNFLDTLDAQLNGGPVAFSELNGIKTGSTNNINGRWEIRDVFKSEGGNTGWVEVASTAENAQGSQTVIRRVGFGDPDIFQLAMLTETVNCMFCHLRVNGDVGSLDFLRPGWGTEGVNGHGSGGHNGGSRINGNVFAARNITNDNTNLNGNPKTINGAQVTGAVEVNSTSSKLPKDQDGDGIPDFPPIKRETAIASAKGTVSGASVMRGAPTGTAITNVTSSNLSAINQTYDGNLILVGTPTQPINLNGDVYVTGDVIIKGVVTGTGAIYSGRNIYFAGDTILQNPPDLPNTGVCSGISNPDLCARANILANKDTLRTGARGNIIIGDYTEYSGGVNTGLMPWSRLQSSDFYREQFGFKSGNRHYDRRNGDELSLKNGKYYNVDGTEVTSTHVRSISASGSRTTNVSGDEAYDYTFRPGKVNSDGSFSTWLQDDTYRQLLGTETFTHNTWRFQVPSSISQSNFNTQLQNSFTNTGITLNSTTLTNAWNNRNRTAEVELRNTSNQVVGRLQWSGWTLRVIASASATYETQVKRIDAFLYANQRIAGKTSMNAMAIEGGMIAQEIGVLAPGRRIESPFNNDFPALTNNCHQTAAGIHYVKGSEDCALTVNYDYRLRNGGYGFNLVTGDIGKTISWRVAKDSSEKVSAQ